MSEQIIGTWKPIKYVTVCTSGNNDIENLTGCEHTGRLTVKKDGTWSVTYFSENNIDNKCKANGVDDGTWKIVEGKLIVEVNGIDEIEFTFFKITENTLKIGGYDTGLGCDGDKSSLHTYLEHKRI